MIRPTVEVKLPMSGYTAHVATYATYEDKQMIAKAIAKGMQINQETAKEMMEGKTKVDVDQAIDSQLETVKRMTIKLIAPDGTEENPNEVVNLPESDVDLIVEQISKEEIVKKKSAESSSESTLTE